MTHKTQSLFLLLEITILIFMLVGGLAFLVYDHVWSEPESSPTGPPTAFIDSLVHHADSLGWLGVDLNEPSASVVYYDGGDSAWATISYREVLYLDTTSTISATVEWVSDSVWQVRDSLRFLVDHGISPANDAWYDASMSISGEGDSVIIATVVYAHGGRTIWRYEIDPEHYGEAFEAIQLGHMYYVLNDEAKLDYHENKKYLYKRTAEYVK